MGNTKKSKTDPFTPSPDELFRKSEQRAIRAAVAIYTIKDLVVADKVKIDDLSDFYALVDDTYQKLLEISAGEASPNQKQLLVNYLRTSTFDEDQANAMGMEIQSPFFTWKQFNEMRNTIMCNQQDQLKDRGAGSAKDIQKKLDEIEEDKTK